jgi:oxygen-independent coproporphyrinogen-3 oxidase
MKGKIPLSLYLHFPWCVRKCPYCDFNSHESQGELPERAYIDAIAADLNRDLEAHSASQLDRPINSIFMGGGTPSLFSANAMTELLNILQDKLSISSATEITLEANPGTTDFEKFAGYRTAGINRLSIGVQSFSGQQLENLGRIHTANEVTEAFCAAREAGFENINLDLMHGLPGQNADTALYDLDAAINLGPEHISWYQLTIEPNTVFYKRPPVLPDDDTLWEIYQSGLDRLGAAGYERYEISAFARPDKQARHNLNYWEFGDYLGLGAGAHGKLTGADSMVRTAKSRLPNDYLKAQKSAVVPIKSEDLILEFLMNALRLSKGFSKATFTQRTGLDSHVLDNFLGHASSKGFLQVSEADVRPSDRGLQYLNELLMLVD